MAVAVIRSLVTLILLCVCTASKEIESQVTSGSDANRHLRAGKHRRKRVAQTQSLARPGNTSSSRIVGGSPAGAGTYPFIVSLFSVNDPTGLLPVCGK
jgi:secreted trypsin-like serine protease